MQTHNFMETESITKLLLKFSIPSILGLIINALYNIVDRIYIGSIKDIGHLALSGVGVIFPIIILKFSISVLLGIGVSSNVSLNLGKKKLKEADEYLTKGVFLGLILSIIITFIIFIFADKLTVLLGGSDVTSIYGITYIKICCLGFPASVIGYIFYSVLKSDGYPKVAMVSLVLGALTNIILDPIFIFKFKMGVAGAAYATVISQYIALFASYSYFLLRKTKVNFNFKYFNLDFNKLKKIISFGSSAFFIQMVGSIVIWILNIVLKELKGDIAIGAVSIINSLNTFFLMPVIGIGHGMQALIGYNYGAKRYDRVKEIYFKSAFASTVSCILVFVINYFFSKYFISLFSKNQELFEFTKASIVIFTLPLPIIGVQIITSFYFQVIGKFKISLFMTFFRQAILIIPCIFIMSRLFGVKGVWFSFPISETISLIFSSFFLRREWKFLTQLENEQELNI